MKKVNLSGHNLTIPLKQEVINNYIQGSEEKKILNPRILQLKSGQLNPLESFEETIPNQDESLRMPSFFLVFTAAVYPMYIFSGSYKQAG